MSSSGVSNGSASGRKPPSKDDPLPRESLPADLQKIVDDEDTLMDQVYDGK